MAAVTVVAAWRYLGRDQARPLLAAIGGWAILALLLDEPVATRITLFLVLLVVAGALLNVIRGPEVRGGMPARSPRGTRDLRYPSRGPGR